MPAINVTNTLVNATNTMSNKTQIVNFALNGKLLANQSDNGRILMPSANASSGTLSLPIILVLIFIMASIVGIIVTALFVMRRRFSTWRLDGTKTSPDDNPEQGGLTEKDIKDEVKTDLVDEKAQVKTSDTVEADTNEEKATAATTEATVTTTVDTNQPEAKDGQASPSSASPLINETDEAKTEEKSNEVEAKVEEVAKTTEETTVQSNDVPIKEQVTSSSSLIVNVLNELSESVACKLAGEVNADPEKEPLNNE